MNHRYEFLDGLRGVAALMVVLLHFLQLTGRDKDFVPHAHLAVDLFFCLSGFVLAHAYSARLRAGIPLTVGRFYLSRVIRLYPMLILGLVAGTSVITIGLLIQHRTTEIWNLLGASLTNLFLLPSPLFLGNSGAAWPANSPQWSLFFEFLASFAFPWLLRLSDRALIAVMVVSGGAVLALALSSNGVDGGDIWKNWPLGSIRVAYPFTIGIYLLRFSSRIRLEKSVSVTKSMACVALLIAIFTVHVPERSNGIYEAVAVLVLFPALMLFSASVSPISLSRPLVLWLGAISYPLYAIHYAIVRAVAGTLRRLESMPPWQHGIVIAGALAACVLIAWVCLRKIDEPARRWLTDRSAIAGRARSASPGGPGAKPGITEITVDST